MKFLHNRALIVIGAALALGIAGGVAVAQIPSADGTISACFVKSTGTLRVIDKDSTNCKRGETLLQWNQAGQPGAPGEDGTDGTDGVSGYELVTKDSLFDPDTLSSLGGFFIDCPDGKVALGGGGAFLGENGIFSSSHDNTLITTSHPSADGTGWFITYEAANIQTLDMAGVRGFATCASMN